MAPSPVGQTANPDPSSGSTVEIVVVGQAPNLVRLPELVHQGALVPHRLEWTRQDRFSLEQMLSQAPGNARILRCWVDASQPRMVRVHFMRGNRERFLVRELPVPEGLGDLELEALAQIIELSAGAMLEDQDSGLTLEQARIELAASKPRPPSRAPSRQPSPPPPSPAPAQVRLRAGLAYAGQLYGPGPVIIHGPELSVFGERRRVEQREQIGLSVQLAGSQSVSDQRVGLNLRPMILRAQARLLRTYGKDGRAGAVGGQLGLGLLALNARAERAQGGQDYTLMEPRDVNEFFLSAGANWTHAWLPYLDVGLVFTLDFAPRVHRFELFTQDGYHSVFQPYTWRPGAALQAMFP